MYSSLYSPVTLAGLSLKNRIVMPPMVIWAADRSAGVTDAHLAHYRERKGPGLVIVEATAVSPEGRLMETQLGIFDDRHVEGLKRLVDVLHANGSVAGIQINHAGGKATLETTYGETPLVPSASAYPADKVCREIDSDDIERITGDFVAAVSRAVKAGFDLVEIHGAHGYLACQFLSPLTNRRTDSFGGSLSNRQRFLLDLFREAHAEAGTRAVVSCRLGIAENGGLTMEEGIDTALKLQSLGMPLVHVSNAHSVPDGIKCDGSPYSPVMHLAIQAKEALRIPVIGVAGITDPEIAETLADEELVDLVAVGRALLADPLWAVKALDRKPETILSCRRCSPCRCFSDLKKCPVRIDADRPGYEGTLHNAIE